MKRQLTSLLMVLLAVLAATTLTACGDDKDDEPDNSTNYAAVLPGHWENIEVSGGVDETIGINYKGAKTIAYEYIVDNDWGVMAFGTYTLDGDKLKASYTDVTVKDEDWNGITLQGFSDGVSKSVTYTIVSCDGTNMTLKDGDGKTKKFRKYVNVN